MACMVVSQMHLTDLNLRLPFHLGYYQLLNLLYNKYRIHATCLEEIAGMEDARINDTARAESCLQSLRCIAYCLSTPLSQWEREMGPEGETDRQSFQVAAHCNRYACTPIPHTNVYVARCFRHTSTTHCSCHTESRSSNVMHFETWSDQHSRMQRLSSFEPCQ